MEVDLNINGVYFFKNYNFIKIGVSKNISKRLKDIDSRCLLPLETKCIGFLEGKSYAEEKKIHSFLKEYRVRGEWFDIDSKYLKKYLLNEYKESFKDICFDKDHVEPKHTSILKKEVQTLKFTNDQLSTYTQQTFDRLKQQQQLNEKLIENIKASQLIQNNANERVKELESKIRLLESSQPKEETTSKKKNKKRRR